MEGAQVLHSRDQALPPATTLNCVQQYHPNKGLKMDQNQFAHIRDSKNVYYPFTLKASGSLQIGSQVAPFRRRRSTCIYIHNM